MCYIKLDQNTFQLVIFINSSFANNKNMSLKIDYIICLIDVNKKANIIHWSLIKYKLVTQKVLAAEFY